ncbi:LysR substrate-binding domain-containing protein [Pseudomonas sp. Bc-h]|uniref:LysR substrate-binding domain-containing protein n=1 Tax=Pseudomonas sp. Bc-h TaxID=1943632 RepID=UPI0022AAC296|nr:LysR substrate-binding domain-containing protein [Pseudomonas sp. Bc-h]
MAAALDTTGLQEACLIHSTNRAADWQKWFDAHPHHGMHKARARQLSFSNSTLAYEAAITGNGIALAEVIVSAADIANDKLVVPFTARLVTGRGLYMLEPQQSPTLQAVGLLRQWIIEESALHDVLAQAYK